MPYIPFTEEQKLRANNVNLVEFLRRQGEKLIPSGQDKRLASDHSITVRGNEWYDHESKEGGHAISFVQMYYGLTYPEAVKCLLDGEGVAYPQTVPSEPEKPKEFVLPPASPAMRRLYAYLLQQRSIDRDVLDAFTKRGMIYESCEKSRDGTKEYHNAVFVGSDEYGTARHAHKRGLYTQGNSFRRNVEGGDPRCSFHWFGNSGRLYVFEAPIDLLAFLTLYSEAWREHSYVALCGTSEQAMLWMLEKDPRLQKVVLCLDHDAAGIEATGRLTDILREHGHTRVSVLRPEYKDWDEDLKALNGLPAQPAEQHPQLQAAELCLRPHRGEMHGFEAGRGDAAGAGPVSMLSQMPERKETGNGHGLHGGDSRPVSAGDPAGMPPAGDCPDSRSGKSVSAKPHPAPSESDGHPEPDGGDLCPAPNRAG